jgi:predicted secreted protein
LNFINQAIVNANVAGGGTLTIQASTTANTGTLEATGGGTLEFSGATVNNTNGTISTDSSSSVIILSSMITGGNLTSASGAEFQGSVNADIDGVTITSGSTYSVDNGSNNFLSGDLTNNGTVLVGNGSGIANLVVSPLTATLSGNGTVVMNAYTVDGDTYTSYFEGNGNDNTLLNQGNTISGAITGLNVIDVLTVPPTATTQAASGVTPTAATLNGGVNPHESDTTVSFVYGTDSTTLLTTGMTTATQAIGSGTSAVAVTAALTGLQPGTTYYYEVVATSAGGTTDGGPILSFTTLAPPIATTQAASGVTATAAMLNSSVNPQGSAAAVSFVYGTDPTLTTGTTTTTAAEPIGGWTSAVAVTAALTGLQPGTTYYYEVVATSAGGTGDGTPLSFTTVQPALTSIAVAPVNPSVAEGLTDQFTATGIYSDGSTANLTTQVTWASGTNSVATISNTAGSQGLASTLATGTTAITATLSGITSPADTLTVTAAALTSIAVSPTNPTVSKGLTEQFTATGTYSDGSTADLTTQVTWASATPSVATISSTGLAQSLAIGTTNITAALGSVTSPSDTLTVSAAALTSIAVSPTNPTVSKGLTEQFTATGTYSDGSTADLTTQVTWASATTSVATISNASGSQGLASTLATGTTAITATLSGITSPADTLTVNVATTMTVGSSPNTSVFGQSVTFTATVNAVVPRSGTPTGFVTFLLDGSTTLGTAPLSSGGKATFTTKALPAGTDTITAVYSGNSNFATSTSTATQTVNPDTTTTTVGSSPNASVFGQSVTFTATVNVVAPGSGTPTGFVTFLLDGSTTLGTAPLSSGGKATFTTKALPVGLDTITANYSGDANDKTSTNTASLNVTKDTTTTTLASSANPAVLDQTVTFTATVSVVTPGMGTPGGNVEFKDGATVLATVPVGGGGVATFTTTSLTQGAHSITAVYSGDSNDKASTSAALGEHILSATTVGLTSSSPSATFGSPVTFTATVADVAPGTGVATGTVSYYDGSTLIGTAPIVRGVATLKLSTLAVGSYSIYAVYDGDTSPQGSTSGTITQKIIA